ncbi:MAG: hypothetical protein IPK32_26235 [Verrucomicrobiaceae bacterium]|nr:hypothetical protein [Verrucomicrobiaceae bacterium]
MIYLLDTDTTILMMRGLSILEPKSEKQRQRQETGRRILAKCRQHAAEGHVIGLSAITLAELEYGACGANDPTAERARMQRILAPLRSLISRQVIRPGDTVRSGASWNSKAN